MPANIVIRIVVTGLTAIVPSAQDKDVTRLIAPSHVAITAQHPLTPEHFAFIEVHSSNLLPGGRRENFRFHSLSDPAGDDRVVFILKSEEVALEHTPAKRTLVRNTTVPKKGLPQPEGNEELQSTVYELEIAKLCAECKSIANEYFDVIGHPDKAALRMDLVGGKESVQHLSVKPVWRAKGTSIDQPFTQEVVYEFATPGRRQRLLLTRAGAFPGDSPQKSTIGLQASQAKPVEVIVGNAPLLTILRLDADFKGEHQPDDFALVYDMFTPAPQVRPVLEIAPGEMNVRGPRDNCIPPHTQPQDPKP